MARPKIGDRADDILDAALRLLRTGGLSAVTTNALAAEAKCSKDTLYALFEDRDAILAALVGRQAGRLNATFDESPDAQESTSLQAKLAQAGAHLYGLLLSDASLAINRAAIADATGKLSEILIASGKARSAPHLTDLIRRLSESGAIEIESAEKAYRSFYGLLIGDRQILALHGSEAVNPPPDECRQAGHTAVDGLLALYHPR